MRQTRELEQITIRLQDNGEGTVGFQHRIRVRGDDGQRIADGDSLQARIRLADFREQSFTVDGITITGAQFQAVCGLIAEEMERQAEARERENRRLQQEKEREEKRLSEEKEALAARHAAEQQALADAEAEANAAAEAAEAELQERLRGTADRG